MLKPASHTIIEKRKCSDVRRDNLQMWNKLSRCGTVDEPNYPPTSRVLLGPILLHRSLHWSHKRAAILNSQDKSRIVARLLLAFIRLFVHSYSNKKPLNLSNYFQKRKLCKIQNFLCAQNA